jgi:hypothetical protein
MSGAGLRTAARVAAGVGLLAGAVLGFAAPAAAEVVDPAGACTASAAWTAGGFTRTTAQLAPGEVVEIPRGDQVAWSGAVVGPAAGAPRQVAGRVQLRLPAPFGTVDIADWGGEATEVERSGSYTYDLPSLVPSGVRLDLAASHDEGGRRHCTAAVGLIIPGGPFDSPLTWVALAGLVVFTGLLALVGRSVSPPGAGRIVGGALLGLPAGLFLGLTLVLFGLIPLASPLVTPLIVLGAAGGAAWAWWSPLGAKTPAPV